MEGDNAIALTKVFKLLPHKHLSSLRSADTLHHPAPEPLLRIEVLPQPIPLIVVTEFFSKATR